LTWGSAANVVRLAQPSTKGATLTSFFLSFFLSTRRQPATAAMTDAQVQANA